MVLFISGERAFSFFTLKLEVVGLSKVLVPFFFGPTEQYILDDCDFNSVFTQTCNDYIFYMTPCNM